jgi:hypothetical protein
LGFSDTAFSRAIGDAATRMMRAARILLRVKVKCDANLKARPLVDQRNKLAQEGDAYCAIQNHPTVCKQKSRALRFPNHSTSMVLNSKWTPMNISTPRLNMYLLHPGPALSEAFQILSSCSRSYYNILWQSLHWYSCFINCLRAGTFKENMVTDQE